MLLGLTYNLYRFRLPADFTRMSTEPIKIKWTMRCAEGMLRNLTEGSYYLNYYDGAQKRMESVGRNPKEALTDNSAAERALRDVALGRKNYLFC